MQVGTYNFIKKETLAQFAKFLKKNPAAVRCVQVKNI